MPENYYIISLTDTLILQPALFSSNRHQCRSCNQYTPSEPSPLLSFPQLPFVVHNAGRAASAPMPPLPLPPNASSSLPHKLNTYADVPEEPVFDPDVHLDLRQPKFVRTFPDFEAKERMTGEEADGARFAWSSPFQVRETIGGGDRFEAGRKEGM